MNRDVTSMKMKGSAIDKLDDQEMNATMRSLGMLTDPTTRKIMAKLASKHSPIAVNRVPVDKIGASRPQIISRLCLLENCGYVTSTKEMDGDSFYKIYRISKLGSKFVDKYMSAELSKFQSL